MVAAAPPSLTPGTGLMAAGTGATIAMSALSFQFPPAPTTLATDDDDDADAYSAVVPAGTTPVLPLGPSPTTGCFKSGGGGFPSPPTAFTPSQTAESWEIPALSPNDPGTTWDLVSFSNLDLALSIFMKLV